MLLFTDVLSLPSAHSSQLDLSELKHPAQDYGLVIFVLPLLGTGQSLSEAKDA